jgi:DNA primase
MRRRVSEAVLVYDGDAAGRKAMERSLDIFLKEGFPCRAVLLPDGEDPDSFVAKGGDLNVLVDKAVSLFDVCLELTRRRHDFGSIEGRLAAVGEIAPALAAMEDPLARELYIKRACESLGVEERLFRVKISSGAARREEAEPEPPAQRDPQELALARLLVHNQGARRRFMDAGGEKWLEGGDLRELALFVASREEDAESFPIEIAPARLQDLLTGLVMEDVPGDFDSLSDALEKRRLKKISVKLAESMKEAGGKGDWENFSRLAKEKEAIDRKISNA